MIPEEECANADFGVEDDDEGRSTIGSANIGPGQYSTSINDLSIGDRRQSTFN